MFCPYCGKEIAKDAVFCSYCGKSISVSDTSPKIDDTSWEYCQTQTSTRQVNGFFNISWECYFWAESVGKNGPYCVAKTDKYSLVQTWKWEPDPNPPMGGKSEDQEKANRLLNDLIKTLQHDGWEVLPDRGTHVWQYKLRRKVLAK